MPDAIFAHPRLARVYDAFDADRSDLAAYLAIADEVSARRVLDTDDGWERALRGIRAALRPHGWLVFETRRPERRAWQEWARDVEPVVLDIAGVGRVQRRLTVTDVSLPLVSFRYVYRFLSDGMIVTSYSTLRFRGRDEIAAGLAAHGYLVRDVRDAPDRPGREFVFLATRADAATPPA